MIMVFLYGFLLLAFISGSIASLSLGDGIRVSLLDIAVAVFVAYFFKTVSNRKKVMGEYLRLFGPFIAVAFLSLLFQVQYFTPSEIVIASFYLWRFIFYSLVSLTAVYTANVRKWALSGLWISGVIIGTLGLLQYSLYPNLRNLSYLGWDPHEFRVFSTLFDPNFTGIILVLTIILGIYFLKNRLTSNKYRIIIVGLLLCGLSLLFTYSRGSYIAFMAMLLTWATLHKKFNTGALILLLIGLLLVVLPRPGGEGVRLLRTISIESRIKNSQEAIRLFLTSPFVGVGFNTLRFVRDKTGIATGTTDISHSGAGFHNGWLFLLVTTGIIGSLTYLWMWWKILGRDRSTVGTNPLQELVFLSLVAVATHSLFDNSLFYPWTMLWLWIVAGSKLKGDSLSRSG